MLQAIYQYPLNEKKTCSIYIKNRLDPQFNKKCRNDALRFCQQDIQGHEDTWKMPIGLVISCLHHRLEPLEYEEDDDFAPQVNNILGILHIYIARVCVPYQIKKSLGD